MAFSDDDGATWTKPVVLGRRVNADTQSKWVSYPHIFEHSPGKIWVTTQFGKLKAIVNENDFAIGAPKHVFDINQVLPQTHVANTEIMDCMFTAADWKQQYQDNSTFITVEPSSMVQTDIGSNTVMRVKTQYQGSTGGSGSFVQGLVFQNAVIKPSAHEGLISLNYSLTQNRPTNNNTCVHLFMLEQGGRYYVYNVFQRDVTQDGMFTTFAQSNLVAEDFQEERPDNGFALIAGSHPDFGSDAADIRIGVMIRMTSSVSTPLLFETDFDDFVVEVRYGESRGYVENFGTATALESVPGSVSFKFDDYVSPSTISASKGDIMSFFSPCTAFIEPNNFYSNKLPLPSPAGVLVSAVDGSSPQNVRFYDNLSSCSTSDIFGPGNDTNIFTGSNRIYDKLIFAFVNSEKKAATVSRAGFRFGAVNANSNAKVKFYDIEGNELFCPNNNIPAGGTDGTSEKSYICKSNAGVETSLIHKVEFSRDPVNVPWFIGSYSQPLKKDMVYYGMVSSYLDIIKPSVNSYIYAGKKCSIEWSRYGAVSNIATIKLEYFDGSNWHIIGDNILNTGSYSWAVPDVSSSACKIRISSAGSEFAADISQLFRISRCGVADLTGNCVVDICDLARLAQDWLKFD
jgi:hypothetical protein